MEAYILSLSIAEGYALIGFIGVISGFIATSLAERYMT